MILFGLFMWSVLAAKFAELLDLEAIFEGSLIFSRIVVDLFTLSTFEFNHVVLRHRRTFKISVQSIPGRYLFVNSLAGKAIHKGTYPIHRQVNKGVPNP